MSETTSTLEIISKSEMLPLSERALNCVEPSNSEASSAPTPSPVPASDKRRKLGVAIVKPDIDSLSFLPGKTNLDGPSNLTGVEKFAVMSTSEDAPKIDGPQKSDNKLLEPVARANEASDASASTLLPTYAEFIRKRRLAVIAFALRMFTIGVESTLILPSAWDYVKVYENSLTFLGLVISASPLSSLIFLPILGQIYDRTKRIREITLVTNAFFITGNIVYSLHYSKWCILFGRCISGVGNGFMAIAVTEIGHTFLPEDRVGVMALLGVVQIFGFMLGPLFNLIVMRMDFRIGTWLIDKKSAAGFVTAILWIFMTMLTAVCVTNLARELGQSGKTLFAFTEESIAHEDDANANILDETNGIVNQAIDEEQPQRQCFSNVILVGEQDQEVQETKFTTAEIHDSRKASENSFNRNISRLSRKISEGAQSWTSFDNSFRRNLAKKISVSNSLSERSHYHVVPEPEQATYDDEKRIATRKVSGFSARSKASGRSSKSSQGNRSIANDDNSYQRSLAKKISLCYGVSEWKDKDFVPEREHATYDVEKRSASRTVSAFSNRSKASRYSRKSSEGNRSKADEEGRYQGNLAKKISLNYGFPEWSNYHFVPEPEQTTYDAEKRIASRTVSSFSARSKASRLSRKSGEGNRSMANDENSYQRNLAKKISVCYGITDDSSNNLVTLAHPPKISKLKTTLRELTAIEILALCGIELTLSICQAIFVLFITPLVQEEYGWSQIQTSLLYLGGSVIVILVLIVVVIISKKHKVKDVYYTLVAIALAIVTVALVFAETLSMASKYRAIAFVIAIGTAFAAFPLTLISIKTQLNKIARYECRGTIQAMEEAMTRLAMVFGPFLGGVTFHHRREYCSVAAGVLLAEFFLLLAVKSRILRREAIIEKENAHESPRSPPHKETLA